MIAWRKADKSFLAYNQQIHHILKAPINKYRQKSTNITT